jgi:hypothetical protein
VEKVWSIGDSGTNKEEQGQVEKSITEAMTGEKEQHHRSRKASHGLRLFKEGLPEEKVRRRDTKDGSKKRIASPVIKEESYDSTFYELTGNHPAPKDAFSMLQSEGPSEVGLNRSASDGLVTATADTETHAPLARRPAHENSKRSEEPEILAPNNVYDRPRTLPQQLLDDLRKRHNLTPAAAKGSSFSKSIPLTDSEKKNKDASTGDLVQEERHEHIQEGDLVESPVTHSDEEESSEEKISSALFVPHQSKHDIQDHHPSPLGDLHSDRHSTMSEAEQWLEEHEVHPRESEQNKLSSPQKTPDLTVPRARTTSGYFAPPDTTHHVDWAHVQRATDTGYHTQTETSFASHFEDPDVTPTDNRGREYMSKNQERQQPLPPAPKTPLEAIELIPYKHQVGGHTTLWRFSKRAVCKQLNNRENEFYEIVEHYHPELLKFMPRYVNVCPFLKQSDLPLSTNKRTNFNNRDLDC